VGSEGELILQVFEEVAFTPAGYGYQYQRESVWRDATVADIPVADPFAPAAPTFAWTQAQP
jgi:hypothetical protein